jgi:hypothetical protein
LSFPSCAGSPDPGAGVIREEHGVAVGNLSDSAELSSPRQRFSWKVSSAQPPRLLGCIPPCWLIPRSVGSGEMINGRRSSKMQAEVYEIDSGRRCPRGGSGLLLPCSRLSSFVPNPSILQSRRSLLRCRHPSFHLQVAELRCWRQSRSDIRPRRLDSHTSVSCGSV